MNDAPPEGALPPSLRFLKWLVIVLTLTMIVGVITVVGLIVTRMPQAFAMRPGLPDSITLPEGETADAVTYGKGWIAVVTASQKILVFSKDGTLRQEVQIAP